MYGERRGVYRVFVGGGDIRERDYLEELGGDGMIILKLMYYNVDLSNCTTVRYKSIESYSKPSTFFYSCKSMTLGDVVFFFVYYLPEDGRIKSRNRYEV